MLGGNKTMKIILCPNPFRDKGLKIAKSAENLLHGLGVNTVYCLPFPVERDSLGDIDQTFSSRKCEPNCPMRTF